MTLDETLSLLVLCYELGDECGIPFHRAARTAALKLLSSLPNHLRESAADLTESISVQLDPRNPLEGAQPNYQLLTQAVSKNRQVRIRYRSLTEWNEISTLLSPYRVLFHRRSWYVIGRSSLHRSVRTFNIGRIVKAEMLNSQFQIPPRFNLERYLGNAWSLIRERGKRFDVVVRFQKMVASNVAEVQWHKTQTLKWNDDGTLDYQVSVDGLNEIKWWILGYGDQAEAITPPELRDELRRHIDAMHKTYSSPNPKPTGKRRSKHKSKRSRQSGRK